MSHFWVTLILSVFLCSWEDAHFLKQRHVCLCRLGSKTWGVGETRLDRHSFYRSQLNHDAFDHDKGQQKSVISGHCLLVCNLVRKSPHIWRKLPDFRAERKAQNPVTPLLVTVFGLDKTITTVANTTKKQCSHNKYLS